MADVFSALYQNTDDWDGTNSWGGYSSQALRDMLIIQQAGLHLFQRG